ncbi:MAG: hypothetical protein KHY28_02035 [Firmicutes bacterium]|jgi:hypothetical protein|nr:hypothetical protein [Bacillota bacterium]
MTASTVIPQVSLLVQRFSQDFPGKLGVFAKQSPDPAVQPPFTSALALRRVKIFCLAPSPFFFSGGMNYEQEL